MGHPTGPGSVAAPPRQRSSRRREQILDAIEQLFLERGFQVLTIDDLVAAAGCSRSTLYALADTKENLFLLVLDRMWRRLRERAREAQAISGDAGARVEAFLCAGINIFPS